MEKLREQIVDLQKQLREVEDLLIDAHGLLDDIYGYDTETAYFNGE